MINAIKPSLEEASPIQTREDALSYIGSRGVAGQATREERINSAKLILEENFLPHVSTQPGNENLKAYFLGYMTYWLIFSSLGFAPEDDRDHYGKKRLDMAGSLLGSLFYHNFRQLIKDAKLNLQRQINKGARDWPINLS